MKNLLNTTVFCGAVAVAVLCCVGLITMAASQMNDHMESLDIYFIDVEGGQSTLFVSPTGESMLVDTGGQIDSQGNLTERDPLRVIDVVKHAGLTEIDYLVSSHFMP